MAAGNLLCSAPWGPCMPAHPGRLLMALRASTRRSWMGRIVSAQLTTTAISLSIIREAKHDWQCVRGQDAPSAVPGRGYQKKLKLDADRTFQSRAVAGLSEAITRQQETNMDSIKVALWFNLLTGSAFSCWYTKSASDVALSQIETSSLPRSHWENHPVVFVSVIGTICVIF